MLRVSARARINDDIYICKGWAAKKSGRIVIIDLDVQHDGSLFAVAGSILKQNRHMFIDKLINRALESQRSAA